MPYLTPDGERLVVEQAMRAARHLPHALRHAQHVDNPHPECGVCVAKAAPAAPNPKKAEPLDTRAVGGFVQSSPRYVRL